MNLASMLDRQPDDAVAIISRGRPSTYGALRAQAGSLRRALGELGLQRGDHVAIMCSNNRYFVVSYFAIIGAGMVAVPLNPTSPLPATTAELNAVRAKALIAGPTARPVAEAIDKDKVPALKLVIGAGYTVGDAPDLVDLLAGEPADLVDVAASDPAVLMFTSGTAGLPKAAVLTHGNLEVNIRQQLAHDPSRSGAEVCLGVIPLYHIFGLNVVLGSRLAQGSSVVLIEKFDPISAIESVIKHKVTELPGPPTMWGSWALLDDIPADVFANIRLAVSGAARLPRTTYDTMKQRFGIEVREGYGLTEASPVVTTATGTDAPYGSIGIPVPGLEVRLVDRDGQDTYVGDPGEIWLRGPNIFTGYYDNPDATNAVLDDEGWLHTGDIAVVDDDGYLYLVNRSKDLIIVSGFNVFPLEVERVLMTHPAVLDAAVVGQPNPHTGESVLAHVVVRDGFVVDEETLIRHCATQLARYKCPKKVWFEESIPKDLGGKLLRRMLRERQGA